METSQEWRAANGVEFGRALARLRQSRGLHQSELAERIGAHRQYISKMESGWTTEQLDRVFAILREMGYELVLSPREASQGV